MKTIIRNRDSGKAQELLQYAREHNAFIVTENKRAFRVKANSLGYDDIEIIDYDDLIEDDFSEFKPCLIHNADKWLKDTFWNNYRLSVIGFSATEGE